MKIGITCYPTYGGSGALATELGIALARRGHEIHFITYEQPFRLPAFLPRIYFHEVDVGRYPLFEYPPYDLALAVRMHEVVLAHGLDLLHCHYAIPHATSAWIAKEMLKPTRPDIRVVTTLHGTDITIVGQDPSFRPITKFSIEKSDGLTAVSRFLQQETLTTFGCTACRIEVIPELRRSECLRSVAVHVDHQRAGRLGHAGADARVELPSGQARARRGPDLRAGRRSTFRRCWSWSATARIAVDAEAEARELGLQDKVFFLGKIDAVAPLLAGADLFLLPSSNESFGLSALEALACGVPVIGTRHGRHSRGRSRRRDRRICVRSVTSTGMSEAAVIAADRS